MRGQGALPGMGVIADDLTGALASAGQLRARGLRTVVQWEPRVIRSAEALVVNIGTREKDAAGGAPLPMTAPMEQARTAAARLRNELHCERIELRIDSTLRGHPDQELEGVLRGIEAPDACVLAVPAWPAAGRITRDGTQVCMFEGLETDMDMDIPVAPVLFPGQRTETLTYALVRTGPTAVAKAVLTGY